MTKTQKKYLHLKRLLDILFCIAALFLLSPLLIIISILIRLTSPGPALFRQKRIGKDGHPFEILKFRSMRTDAPHNTPTHLLADSARYITPIGRLLRSSSLDELPQLFNILKGDMSLIGPRPALYNQTDLLLERKKYGALGIRPGLTGWAQINGRDELDIETKARLDGFYVQHIGLRMDFICFWGTIFSVLHADGIKEGGERKNTLKNKKEKNPNGKEKNIDCR